MTSNIKNIILLIIRLWAGYVIAKHGYDKLMNMDGTIMFIKNMTGLSSGFAWAVALGELLSGLGIIFGAWTRLAAVGAAIIMAGVVYYTGGKAVDGIELLVAAIVLIFAGGGKFAITNCIHGKKMEAPVVTAPSL